MPHPLDSSSDPWTDSARLAQPGAIIPNQVFGQERRMRAVERRGLVSGMVTRTLYGQALGEVSTALTTPQALGGPTLTHTVPDGGALIDVYGECEIDPGDANPAFVVLYATSSQFGTFQVGSYIIWSQQGAGYTGRATMPGPSGISSPVPGNGAPVRLYSANPSGAPVDVDFELRYYKGAGVAAKWRNRRLWVGVARAGT